MIQTTPSAVPQALSEFLDWESTDGFKYDQRQHPVCPVDTRQLKPALPAPAAANVKR